MVTWREQGKYAAALGLGLGAAVTALCVALTLGWPGKRFQGPPASVVAAYVHAWREARPLPLWQPAPDSGTPAFLAEPPLSPSLTAALSRILLTPAPAAALLLGAVSLALVLGTMVSTPLAALSWGAMGTVGILATALLHVPDHVTAAGIVALCWALAAVMGSRLPKGLLVGGLFALGSVTGLVTALAALLFGAARRPGLMRKPPAIAYAAVLPLLQGALLTAPFWLPWLQEARPAGMLSTALFPAGGTAAFLVAMATIAACGALEQTLQNARGKAASMTWEWRCARLGALVMVALIFITAPALKIRLSGVSKVAIAPVTRIQEDPLSLSAVQKTAPSILGLTSGKADITCWWKGASRFQCQAFAITATAVENNMRPYPGWAWAVDGKRIKERKTKLTPGAHELTWTLRQTPLRMLSFALCIIGALWAILESLPYGRRWRHGAIRR